MKILMNVWKQQTYYNDVKKTTTIEIAMHHLKQKSLFSLIVQGSEIFNLWKEIYKQIDEHNFSSKIIFWKFHDWALQEICIETKYFCHRVGKFAKYEFFHYS